MELTLPALATELVELDSHVPEGTDLLSLRLVNPKFHQKSNSAYALFTTIHISFSLTSPRKSKLFGLSGLYIHVNTLLLKAGDDGELGHAT